MAQLVSEVAFIGIFTDAVGYAGSVHLRCEVQECKISRGFDGPSPILNYYEAGMATLRVTYDSAYGHVMEDSLRVGGSIQISMFHPNESLEPGTLANHLFMGTVKRIRFDPKTQEAQIYAVERWDRLYTTQLNYALNTLYSAKNYTDTALAAVSWGYPISYRSDSLVDHNSSLVSGNRLWPLDNDPTADKYLDYVQRSTGNSIYGLASGQAVVRYGNDYANQDWSVDFSNVDHKDYGFSDEFNTDYETTLYGPLHWCYTDFDASFDTDSTTTAVRIKNHYWNGTKVESFQYDWPTDYSTDPRIARYGVHMVQMDTNLQQGLAGIKYDIAWWHENVVSTRILSGTPGIHVKSVTHRMFEQGWARTEFLPDIWDAMSFRYEADDVLIVQGLRISRIEYDITPFKWVTKYDFFTTPVMDYNPIEPYEYEI